MCRVPIRNHEAETVTCKRVDTHITPLSRNLTDFNKYRRTRQVNGLNCVGHIQVNKTKIQFAQDAVTNFRGDAIVNAANETCLGGSGVDGRITEMGGTSLRRARENLPVLFENENSVRCSTGDAKITKFDNSGTELKCKYVIHAVGPDLGKQEGPPFDLKLLEDAYKAALTCAQKQNLETIAFCILSAGIFRGDCPLEEIIRTGLNVIADNVTCKNLREVFFCAYKDDEKTSMNKIIKEIWRPPSNVDAVYDY